MEHPKFSVYVVGKSFMHVNAWFPSHCHVRRLQGILGFPVPSVPKLTWSTSLAGWQFSSWPHELSWHRSLSHRIMGVSPTETVAASAALFLNSEKPSSPRPAKGRCSLGVHCDAFRWLCFLNLATCAPSSLMAAAANIPVRIHLISSSRSCGGSICPVSGLLGSISVALYKHL